MSERGPGRIEIGGKIQEAWIDDLVASVYSDNLSIGQDYDEEPNDSEAILVYINKRIETKQTAWFSGPRLTYGVPRCTINWGIQHKVPYRVHSDILGDGPAMWMWSAYVNDIPDFMVSPNVGNVGQVYFMDGSSERECVSDNDGTVFIDAMRLKNFLTLQKQFPRESIERTLVDLANFISYNTPPQIPSLALVASDAANESTVPQNQETA